MKLQDLCNAEEKSFAFQQAIDESIIMSTTDKKGIVSYANKKFCEGSKFDKSELVGVVVTIVDKSKNIESFISLRTSVTTRKHAELTFAGIIFDI